MWQTNVQVLHCVFCIDVWWQSQAQDTSSLKVPHKVILLLQSASEMDF